MATVLASAGADGVIDISNPDGSDMRSITHRRSDSRRGVQPHGRQDRGRRSGRIHQYLERRQRAARRRQRAGRPPAPACSPGGVMSVTFSPDDQFIASGGADNAVRFWDSDVLSPAGQLPTPARSCASGPGPWPWGGQGHTAPVTSVAFNTDGTRLVSGSDDMTLRLWDVLAETAHRRPDDRTPRLGLECGIYRQRQRKRDRQRRKRTRAAILECRCRPTTYGTSGGWPSGRRDERGDQSRRPSNRVRRCGPHGTAMGLLHRYREQEQEDARPSARRRDHRVAFTPAGDVVASGSADGKIRLWDLTTNTVRVIDTGRPVTAIAISRDGNRLASAGIDGQITIWELPSGRPTPLPNRDHAVVFDVAFNPQGDRLASASVAGIVRVSDLTGRPVWEADAAAQLPKTLRDQWSLAVGHPGEVLAVAFSPDGRLLASGSTDWGTGDANVSAVGVLQRWDANTGTALSDPAQIGYAVMDLAFISQSADPSQDRIVAASFDPYTVQLWSATNGSQYTFTGHEAQVVSVAVSPGRNTRIVSGSVDGTVRIWPNLPTIPAADALCAKLVTTMSQHNWTKWVAPQIPYRNPCPGLPPTSAGMPN